MLGKVTFSAGFTGKTKGGKVLLRAAIAGEGNIKREQFCKDYDNLWNSFPTLVIWTKNW